MAVTGTEAAVLLVARVVFGGVLAVMGLNHFGDREGMAAYAEQKGLPAPGLSVLASGAVLVLGGLAIVFGVYPVVGAGAIAAFLVVSAVTMHDFWAVPADQTEDEMTQFLKNLVMAAGALAVGVLATSSWGFSVGVGLV